MFLAENYGFFGKDGGVLAEDGEVPGEGSEDLAKNGKVFGENLTIIPNNLTIICNFHQTSVGKNTQNQANGSSGAEFIEGDAGFDGTWARAMSISVRKAAFTAFESANTAATSSANVTNLEHDVILLANGLRVALE